ncbi:purine and uridine phosphorylase [Aspergillus granulosus]|uniref:Purine and uridine phosphorylase n=1 Tax=Aspergillus granulosus TaxID=176169 RepID=A0ABR4GUG1_9EURO
MSVRGDLAMGQKETLTHDVYTVGWVCVLECELNASRALLDKEHGRLPAAENDDNVYLLGEMNGHNVVIAFPAIYGVGAAARTATNMIRTFRNIRFGLMVGIGGAVPNPSHFGKPTEDIRLGDVVVSEPKGDHGGVIHYDMGQRKADGQLYKRSHLNKPPTMLLNAMKLLRSDHPFGRGEMNRYIADVAQLSELSDAFQAYQNPGRSNDRLYKMDYNHEGGEDCTHCDANSTETRAPRRSDVPVVHYGLIASGNAVIKDPQYRDKLREAWGIACFEMEAAGLMDNFPCLVIRGISDYCDTHKNDIWQPYAAITAAAYAKDLLRIILPQEVCAAKVVEMEEVLDVLSNIQTSVSMIKSSINASQENELLIWLSPKDYGSEQTDMLSQRQEGTGTWLLERAEFQNWVSESSKTIYCRGMPGAGKTVMTAVVVDHLRSRFQDNPAVGIACIYCSVQNEAEQTPSRIFLSLLRQLIKQLSSTPLAVKSMYDHHTRAGDRPSFLDIANALLDTISCFQRTFIVIDALDELLTSESPPKQLVREIFALQEKSKINIFATSRYDPEIAGEFQQSILVDVRAAEDDVARYLDSHIGELPAFVSETPGLEDEIKTGIISAIDGMFLLAKLHLNLFRDKYSIRDVKDGIKSLPKGFNGYDLSYAEAMHNIRSQRQGLLELATKVLSWICCSRRLLLATELQHALAVKDKHTDFDKLSIPDMGLIVSVCKGLVIVDGERGTIRLVHYTTQQYFERTWQQWFSNAHEKIAETTLRYLTFDTFKTGPCLTGTEFRARLDQYVLYDYAARNWAYHVRTALFEETSLCAVSAVLEE